jgi:hypothetical protein
VNGRRHAGVTLAAAIAIGLAGAGLAGAARPAGADVSLPDTGWVEVGGAAGVMDDDPFADLPPDTTPVQPMGGHIRPVIDYNRVDQWLLGIEESFSPKEGWLPGFDIRVFRSTQRAQPGGDGMWLWEMRGEQPLLPKRALLLKGSIHHITDHDHFGQVGDVENALAAYFWRWDYRDYYDVEGTSVGLEGRIGDQVRLGVKYRQDEYTSITQTADGTAPAFRQSAPWRDNPAVDDGSIQSVTMNAEYDNRENQKSPRRGVWLRGEVETAGGSLGGDYAFIRYFGDLRAYFSPAPSHLLKARVLGGTTSPDDALPFQRTFAIGGIGTLRAEPFRQYRGNQLFLVNGDWAWEVLRRSSRNVAIKTGLCVVAWTDLGLAWDSPRYDLGTRRPAWDAGLGFGTTDENFRVYVGRDLRADHADFHWTVRVGRSY